MGLSVARDWQELFKSWAKPPSDTEEVKGGNAARMIKDAVRETGRLRQHRFTTYATGSYRNNTNIKLGSDVDIAVVLLDAFWWTIPAGRRPEEFGLGGSATYGLTAFRSDLGQALSDKFGRDVVPGNKTFDIAGNSYRLPADATPFLVHKAFSGRRNPDGTWHYTEGVETRSVNEPTRRIINWHDQHYKNGVTKNDATNRRYKRVARILKRLRDDMSGSGGPTARRVAGSVPSFLLECLAYNAPNECFNQADGSYYDDVRAVIQSAWNRTKDDSQAARLEEVNELKLLFGAHQAWEREEAHTFMLEAWRHVGFG